MSHGAIFLATCNTILLLRDVNLANTRLRYILLMYSFFTYQTVFTNSHLLSVELRCELHEKLHRVTWPLLYFAGHSPSHSFWELCFKYIRPKKVMLTKF